MRILPIGPVAVLVEDPPLDPAAWSLGLRRLGLPGVTEIVPAARTVLVECGSTVDLAAAIERFDDVDAAEVGDGAEPPTITIPVRYDGADLESVARTIGRNVDEIITMHSGPSYEVGFCGFAPGFGYLRGLPAELHLPRRDTPRTRVPAGSVAIAAEFSAVYPKASPGGWHLLGSTDMAMFDPQRRPPALLAPGTIVEFEPR